AKPKAERFQTADEFREALTRCAAPASAAPLRRAGRLRRAYRPLGAVSAATAAGLLAYAGTHRIPITPPLATASESRISAAPAPSIPSPAGNATAAAAPPPAALKSPPESGAEKSETPFPRLEF